MVGLLWTHSSPIRVTLGQVSREGFLRKRRESQPGRDSVLELEKLSKCSTFLNSLATKVLEVLCEAVDVLSVLKTPMWYESKVTLPVCVHAAGSASGLHTHSVLALMSLQSHLPTVLSFP